jgi:hypothetical protein
MNRKYYLWDKYFADDICDWDIWEIWTREWITNRLHDEDVEEANFTDDEIDYLLDEALDYQRERRDEDKQENIECFEDEITDTISNSYYTGNLNYDDIGKVLVKIAANYFRE